MPRRARHLIALTLACAGLSACADRPDLSGRIAPLPAGTPWPTLLSTDQVTAAVDTSGATPTATTDALAARAAALRARAARLATQPVLSPTERDRLDTAVN